MATVYLVGFWVVFIIKKLVDTVEALSDPSNKAQRLIGTWKDPGSLTHRGKPRVTRPSPVEEQHRLQPKEVAELVAAWQGGASQKELVVFYHISRSTLMEHLRRAKVPPRRALRPEDIQEAVRLYSQGWSLAKLGEKFDVAGATVATALRAAGVSIRPRRGWRPQP